MKSKIGVMFLVMLMICSAVFAFATKPPQCLTNAKAVDYYGYNICGNEKFQQKLVASGFPRDAWTDQAIKDAQMKMDYYKLQPPTGISNPCVVGYQNFDYANACKL